MYVYELKVNVVVAGDRQDLIDKYEGKAVARENSKLWQDDTRWSRKPGTNQYGRLYIFFKVKFLSLDDLNLTLDWLKLQAPDDKADMIGPEGEGAEQEPGSFIHAHKCNHKKVFDNTVVTSSCSDPENLIFKWSQQ